MPHPNYACLARLAGPVAPFPESGIRAESRSTKAELAPLIGHAQAFSIEKDSSTNLVQNFSSNVREWQAQYLDDIREANMRSPHGRAPPEILGKIFVACIDEENMLVPFTLARVCSRWRSVALGTPHLWSTIKVELDNTRVKRLLQVYMERSRQALLRLHICCSFVYWSDSDHIFRDVLVPHAHRWERLAFFAFPETLVALSSMLEGRLHSLKSIRLQTFASTMIHRIVCFRQAPQLSDATIIMDKQHNAIHLPLSQLTSWKTSATIDICHSLLLRAENLVGWALKVLPPSSKYFPPSARVYHYHLVMIDVKFSSRCDTAQVEAFFSAITLPSLQYFFLIDKSQGPPKRSDTESHSSIVSFLRRSSPPLVTLSISLKTLPSSDSFPIDCLHSLSSLAILHIHILANNTILVGDSFIRRLNTKYPGCIAPRLERLALVGPITFSATFAAMVVSRMSTTPPRAHSDVISAIHNRITSELEAAQSWGEDVTDLYF